MKQVFYNNKKVRFLITLSEWFWHNYFRKIITKYTLPFFLSFIVLAIVIYIIPTPFNEKLVRSSIFFSEKLGVQNVNDSYIKGVITTIISSLTIMITLMSAIYVFTYREQKSVSPSASTNSHKNIRVIFVICSIIFNITFGSLLINKYDELVKLEGYTASLTATKHLYSESLFFLITLFIMFYLIITLVTHLFRTMSADKMLQDSVNNTSKLFDKVLYGDRSKLFKKLSLQRYNEFHYSLESVFQNLRFVAENNMNKEFTENINAFKKVIDKFNQTEGRYDIAHVPTFLLKHDDMQFMHAYQSALRSNLSLISTLMKNQQYHKAEELVSLYFYMYLDESTLIKVFQINLNNYLDTIDTSDERQLKIFLEGLSGISEDKTLITYKFLLMKLINKNQLINLTNTVYAFKKYLKVHVLKISLTVILLQNLIKSIEISNYAITGFLVKFLVTNISGKDLNRSLLILKRNKYAFTSVLEAKEEIEGISDSGVYAIKMNDETFDYCYKKAFILLYGQHVYSIKNNLWYVNEWSEKGNEIKLDEEFEEIKYSEYMIAKIKGASSKYGLLFFNDNDVMKSVYEELKLSYPESIKEKEISLPETVSLLLTKIFKL